MNKVQLLCLLCVSITVARESDITRFMKLYHIIPDLISEGPQDILGVMYSNGTEVNKGAELHPMQVKLQPNVSWIPESNDTYYTLIFTDPDAPSREDPILKEWLHWLVVNIPGNQTSKGFILTHYFGAAPPEDSGLHRYVFLLYKQKYGETKFYREVIKKNEELGRSNFSTKQFVEEYFLEGPVYGNFFSAQYDDDVLEVYEQLMQSDFHRKK